MKAIARRREGFAHEVEIDGCHRLVIDEPRSAGGADSAPSPIHTVAGALAACTAITCEMYAARKGWQLGEVGVEVEMELDARNSITALEVTLRVGGELDHEQQRRLLVIAGKCPVHRALANETEVTISDRIEAV